MGLPAGVSYAWTLMMFVFYSLFNPTDTRKPFDFC